MAAGRSSEAWATRKTAAWSLYRQGNALVDPDTNTTLGYEAIYLGSAKLVQSGDPATVELASVTQEVGIGDRLIPCRPASRSCATPRTPQRQSLRGRVVSIYGGLHTVGEAGKFSIIAVNRGRG